MADNATVAALRRQRAHLREVGAEAGKLAENAEFLRLAGVENPDAEPKADRAEEPIPGRKAPERVTAQAGVKRSPGRPRKDSDGK